MNVAQCIWLDEDRPEWKSNLGQLVRADVGYDIPSYPPDVVQDVIRRAQSMAVKDEGDLSQRGKALLMMMSAERGVGITSSKAAEMLKCGDSMAGEALRELYVSGLVSKKRVGRYVVEWRLT